MDSEDRKSLAVSLVEQAVRRGATSAEVVIKEYRELSVGVRLGEAETVKESTNRGLGIRVLSDGRQASVSGSDFSPKALTTLVAEAIDLARATSPDDSAGLPDADEFASPVADLDLYDSAIESLTPDDLITFALRAEQAARDYDSAIVNFEGGGSDCATGSITLANSQGFVGEYRATSSSVSTVPVAAGPDGMQRDYWFDVRRRFSDLESPETVGGEAARRTLRKLGARPVPTQKVPVVFEPNVARELVGDILHAASGESVFRKSSFFVGQLGERVASTTLTVIDDGTLPRGIGSRPFDGEGLATRQTEVIREGVLENYLLNTYTARKLGLRSTGNASRGLVGNPGVEAGNLFIKAGPHTNGEIIRSVKRGFCVTELLGFGVNIVTGDYSRSAAGIWIENGELAFPVQGITLAGNLKEMLNSVEMVGNDLEFRGSIASPTLRIGSMTIGA